MDQNMAIFKKKIIINIILSVLLIFTIIKSGHAELNFKSLENKKVPYLDFFLLKFENTLTKRSQILRGQLFATRVQYSNIGIQVDLDNKKDLLKLKQYKKNY